MKQWKLERLSLHLLSIALLLAGFCSTLWTSQQAQALELTTNVRIAQMVRSTAFTSNISGAPSLTLTSNVYQWIAPRFDTVTVRDGQFFEYTFSVENIAGNNALDSRIPTFYNPNAGATENWIPIGQKIEQGDNSVALVHVYGYIQSNQTWNNIVLRGEVNTSFLENERAVPGYLVIYDYVSPNGGSYVDFTAVINAINNLKTSTDYNGQLLQAIENTLLRSRDFQEDWKDEIIEAINSNATANADKEQQAGEEATTEGQDAADNAQDESNATGQSLLSALAGFVTAITAVNPGSCSLNGQINNNVNLGNLNFCETNPPSFITIIGSIILVVIMIPYVRYMFNKFIGIIRSFQK